MSYLNGLKRLSTLQEGWMNGEGVTFNEEQLNRLCQQFESFYDTSLSLPYFYPNAEGNVWVEWTFDYNWGISLEVDLYSLTAHYEAVQLTFFSSNELDVTLILDLNDKKDWDVLNTELSKFKVS